MVKYIININEIGKKVNIRDIDVRTPCSISIYSDQELDEVKFWLYKNSISYDVSVCDNIVDILSKTKNKKK